MRDLLIRTRQRTFHLRLSRDNRMEMFVVDRVNDQSKAIQTFLIVFIH